MLRIGGKNPEIEHLIGLIEDEYARFRQSDIAICNVIEKSTWRCDQHVHSARHRLDLRTGPHAAEHDCNCQVEMPPVGSEALGDLGREFAGRTERRRPPQPFGETSWRLAAKR